MKNDFLKNLIDKATEEQAKILIAEKRKNHLREIGKKGGLAKKKSAVFSRTVSAKISEKEFFEIQKKAKALNLKMSKYVRLILTEKNLKSMNSKPMKYYFPTELTLTESRVYYETENFHN